ncbi:MAG: hypothetical protein HYY24_19275 [Verrucomicrobia bacterium]|nr:hypothetical protein [Verrucomicrobiota bacterium]
MGTLGASVILAVLAVLVCGVSVTKAAVPNASDCFVIRVVDSTTGRGVPLVELSTVNKVSYWTDSGGLIAFHEPGLMGQKVFFHVRSHGYEFPKDGFGNRGTSLLVTPGGTAELQLKRLNIAERLYRVTGQGIYRDTVLAGRKPPIKEPLLNGQVFGQDTVIATPYRGKIYWFWGDTDRPSYPLGNFAVSGATSEMPGSGGLDPSVGVELKYFVGADGFAKAMCPDFGPGLQWIEGVMTVRDAQGKQRLVARVSSQKGLMPAYAWHLALFNDEKEIFESKVKWDFTEGHDSAHPFRAEIDGVEYLYLYLNLRVKADVESLSDLKNYEAFTCVAGDGKLRGRDTAIERDASGRARYSWKAGADRLYPGRLRELSAHGKLKPDEAWIQLHDFETGQPFEAGRGSVYWNEFRRRWVMTTSARAGEIWFAEGDTPLGPWVDARRVVSHDRYNFYNPTQHPFFDREGGQLIYFEGTYTAVFSAAPAPTPRYDYNQIMYRLDLADPRLALPAPVYRVKGKDGATRYLMREGIEAAEAWERVEEAPFFAIPPGRQWPELAGYYAVPDIGGDALRRYPTPELYGKIKPLFYAWPAEFVIPTNRLEGTWDCRGVRPGNVAVTFNLDLRAVGEVVTGQFDQNSVLRHVELRKGRFTDPKLELEVSDGVNRYLVHATVGDGKFSGSYEQIGAEENETGTLDATRTNIVPLDAATPALVLLYEYRSKTDSTWLYSTNAALANPSLESTPEPVCRVWRNPMSVLALDWQARPVKE